jgi:two-component system, cell cycle sensor histidine kinase and response regulator CckA
MNISTNNHSDKPVLFKPLIILLLLAFLSIGIFLLVFQHYMNSLFEDVEKNYRQSLVNVISVARNAIEPDLAKVRSGEITRDEAIRRIRPLIRSMTYEDQDGKNYIYMATYDGTVLVQPFLPEREMTNRIDVRDIKGLYIARELIRAAKENPGGSFVRYYYSHLPGVHDVQEKMGYVVGLPELECYIVTGMYIEKTLLNQKKMLANVEYASIWLFIITLIPISVSGWVIVSRNRRLMTEVRNRKKADEELLENMELLRATLNATTDGILVVNKENRITQINRQFLDMWRIPAELKAINDDEKLLMFAASQVADSDGFLDKVRALYQSQLDSMDEIVFKDGRVFERYSSPMILAGNEIGRVWDFRDITRRKQAEESVMTSRKLLNDMLQAASEFSIVAIDPDGIIKVFNRGAELMLGYSSDEMVGKQSPLVLHLKSELDERGRELTAELGYPVEGFRVFTAKAEIDGSETREWTFVRKDGSTLFVSLVATAIRSDEGAITGYLGIAKDITKSRQAEEKFSKIFMTSPAGIAITRLKDGHIIDTNRAFEGISGWKSDEVKGRTTEELRFWLNPTDRNTLVRELKTGQDVFYREFQFRRKDGAVRTGVYSARPIQLSGEECLIFIAQDITDRRQTEEKFSKIFMMAPDMVAITRVADGLIADVNMGFEEVTGWKRNEVIGRRSYDLKFWVNPQDRDFMAEELQAGRDVLHREIEFRHKDGSLHSGIYSARIIQIENELSLIFVMQDITQLKETERALREKEERLSGITSTLPGSVFQFYVENSGEYNLSIISRHLPGFLDLPEGMEAAFPTILSYVCKEDRDRFMTSIRTAVETFSPWNFEGRFVKPRSGEIMWFQGLSTPTRHENRLVFNGILLDITERKRVEEMSRLSEEKFSKIFMTVPDCIAITRMKDGKIMDVNPGFKELSGWEPNEAIGKTAHEINFWVDRTERERMVLELEAGSDVLYREFQFRRKEGAVRTGIYSARRIRIADETCILFVMQDITERQRLEEDRKKLESQLLQSQKMDAIGQLAGGVAHDFNNILMSIEGNASLIMMDYTPDHPHYNRLTRIEENVERGARLTKQLLGFAREGKYEVTALSINDLVRNSAKFFTETKKEIESDFQLQGDVYPVEGDVGQLEQVLLNIYINAGHAMPRGGHLHIQTSNISLQEPEAEAFEVKPGDYVKISISDTGTGMDKETLKRIFEPFFTTKAQQGGTGLGLASAYGIIRNHGGALNAYSEPGQGSTFNIYLPSSDKKAATEKSGKPDKKLLSGSGSILLVDDETEILATASQLLEMLGYIVYKAASGQDAIAIYREKENRIDLVILDMIMPGISGSQVLMTLREINPDVKVVLSSGYSLQGEAQNVMEMGCLGFIQKPYNFAQLSAMAHKILNPDSGV